MRLRRRLQRADRLLRQGGELLRLLVGQVDVEGDVAVGAHEHVARVVGEEVHHDVAVLAAVDDEALRVGLARRRAERAAGARLLGGLVAEDVGHPVRGPEPLEAVVDVGEVVRRLRRTPGLLGHGA